MEKNQLIVDSANIYIYKENGEVFPVNHPDLSTQPSVLPERFGKLKINEVLIQISSKDELTDKAITNFGNLYGRIKEGEFIYHNSTIIDAKFFGYDRLIYPTNVIKENGIWKFYFDMSNFLELKYCIIKYFYNNKFR